jgi:hypothetical protein
MPTELLVRLCGQSILASIDTQFLSLERSGSACCQDLIVIFQDHDPWVLRSMTHGPETKIKFFYHEWRPLSPVFFDEAVGNAVVVPQWDEAVRLVFEGTGAEGRFP